MISVLLSVFNEDKYIKSSIESLVIACNNACGNNYEIIVVNDNSNHKCSMILNNICNKYSNIIIINNEENLGLPSSLNKAFDKAKNTFIARMDADDICEPNRFVKQLNFLIDNPNIDILGSNASLINMNSDKIGQTEMPLTHDNIIKRLEFNNPMIHPSIIMKSKVLEELGGYDEKLMRAQDLDLWHRASKHGFKFSNINDSLIRYRVNQNPRIKTLILSFFVEFKNAILNNSVKGIVYSILVLLKNLFTKYNIYRPRSIEK